MSPPAPISSDGRQLLQAFGRNVAARRQALGLKLEDVTSPLGLSPGELSRLEAGQLDIDIDQLALLSRILDIAPEALLTLATDDPELE